MLLQNIIKYKVDSAVDGMPKLDNYFDKHTKKNKKAPKIKKSVYGGLMYHVNGNAIDADGDTDGDGGDGGGGGE